jgi:hypothetical protein
MITEIYTFMLRLGSYFAIIGIACGVFILIFEMIAKKIFISKMAKFLTFLNLGFFAALLMLYSMLFTEKPEKLPNMYLMLASFGLSCALISMIPTVILNYLINSGRLAFLKKSRNWVIVSVCGVVSLFVIWLARIIV